MQVVNNVNFVIPNIYLLAVPCSWEAPIIGALVFFAQLWKTGMSHWLIGHPSGHRETSAGLSNTVCAAAWCSFIRWTCYNCVFLLFWVHAHTAIPWHHEFGVFP